MLRACYVTARSWEPWCSEMFTLPLALGSLGVENCLRNRSLLGALALRACHVTARCWEPWCEELFALPIALLFGVSGPSWGSFWGDFGARLGCLGALLGRLGALLGRLGASWRPLAVLGLSWGPLGAVLGVSWGSLGALLGRLGALLGRFGALLGRLGALLGSFRALLGASWALLGRSLEPPGPFSAVLGPTKRNPEKPSKTIEKSMIFASSGPLGKPLGGHLGRLGGLLDRLGAILGRLGGLLDRLGPNLGVLERSWTVLEPSWTPLGPSWAPLGPSWARLSAPRGLLDFPSPLRSPSALPLRRASPAAERHSLVPRSFRHLGRHGNGKSASATCPRSLMAPFALGSFGVESLLRHRNH